MVRPRLIVTFIDNSHQFYSIAARHPGVRTLFVQNGYRGYYGDVFENLSVAGPRTQAYAVDYMLTFGSRIGIEYKKQIRGEAMAMGSAKNNLFPRTVPKRAGTIAFISQYRDMAGMMLGEKFYTQQAFFEQADRIVLGFLLQYASQSDRELFIVPCSGHYKDGTLQKEQAYFNGLFGRNFNFSEWRWLGSGYDATDSAEIVVSIDSTLAYESAARGNRTAFFSIRSVLLGIPGLTYGWPEALHDEGAYWTNLPDTAAFSRVLAHLSSINDAQWLAELSSTGFADIMAYDPGNAVLRNVLADALGTPGSRVARQ